MKFIFLVTFIISIPLHLVLSQNHHCLPTRCSPSGPIIRFPFRLKDHQPDHCGYSDKFELSCAENGATIFDLQFPLTASTANVTVPLNATITVWNIDYVAQKLLAGNAKAKTCLPENVTYLNNNAPASSVFEAEPLGYDEGYTLFNCSKNVRDYGEMITCLGGGADYVVIAFASVYDVTSLPPYSSCFKMYNVSYFPDNAFTEGDDDEYGARFYVRWREPFCRRCEEKGQYCRLRNGGIAGETECFSPEQTDQHGKGASRSHKPLTAGITAGTILLVFITIASYYILRLMKRKKKEQKRIKNILQNHKNMKPIRYSYTDIKRITSNFNEKFGTLYKGMLVDKTPVAVKILNGSEQNLEDFISEVEKIGRIQHANVLNLIGYCVDRHKRALVYEFLSTETLENFISSEDQRLHRIALGVARGIEYVHQECREKCLILDISPRNIMLDHNFNPKILVVSMDATQGALLSSNFDVLSQKADTFSFGMLLLEILGRRGNFYGGEKVNGEVYYPEWIYNQVNREDGNEMVKKLSIVGLWCIQWFPSDRPSMKGVVRMLQGDNMPVMPPNPFDNFNFSTQK